MKKHKIFVYGTLLKAQVRYDVYRNASPIRKITLDDFKKEGLNIISKKGSKVEGGVIEVNDTQLAYLNRYEGLGHLYKTIKVEPEGEKMIAYQLM